MLKQCNNSIEALKAMNCLSFLTISHSHKNIKQGEKSLEKSDINFLNDFMQSSYLLIKDIIIFFSLLLIVSLAGMHQSKADNSHNKFLQSYSNSSNIKSEHIPIIYQAEKHSSPAGKAVLAKARTMTLDRRMIISGSCWDYLNAVFKKAGVKRDTVFKGTKNGGRYYNTNDIQAGDWLYYINHSYHGIEHSGMFVGWVNKAKKEALILSYAGGNRREPARYKVYDISNTYNVMRPRISGSVTAFQPSKNQNNQKFSSANINKPYRKENVTPNYNQTNNQVNNQFSSLDSFIKAYKPVNNIKSSHISLLHKAEQSSSRAGKVILRQGRTMTLDNQEIIAGTSRNYVKTVFDRAGMTYHNVFVGDYNGTFIDPNEVQSGDWLSYINHSYNQSEHTGIFIGWANKSKNQALILSYGGEGRRHPARYRVYDISNIYHVRRPTL